MNRNSTLSLLDYRKIKIFTTKKIMSHLQVGPTGSDSSSKHLAFLISTLSKNIYTLEAEVVFTYHGWLTWIREVVSSHSKIRRQSHVELVSDCDVGIIFNAHLDGWIALWDWCIQNNLWPLSHTCLNWLVDTWEMMCNFFMANVFLSTY